MRQQRPDPRETHVTIISGSNDLANGDHIDNIISNIDSLIKDTKVAFTRAKVMLSSLNHCVDLSQPNINKAVEKLNYELQILCTSHDAVFINNNVNSTANKPDSGRLRPDGLHLNEVGRDQLASRLAAAIRSPSHPHTTSEHPLPRQSVASTLPRQEVHRGHTMTHPRPQQKRTRRKPHTNRPPPPPPLPDKNKSDNELNIGYNFIRRDRTQGEGGGLLV